MGVRLAEKVGGYAEAERGGPFLQDCNFMGEHGVGDEERLSSKFWGPRETDVLGRGRRWMMLSIDVGILSWGKLGEGVVGNGGVDVRTGASDNLRVCMCVCAEK